MSNRKAGLDAWAEKFEIDLDSLPQVGANEDDEVILIELVKIYGEKVIKWTTCQSNGWNRINFYWPDGTVEEMYER